VLWKTYFKGLRKRCLEFPSPMTKGSPIFNLLLSVMSIIKDNLNWIPCDGKIIKLWNYSILKCNPLSLNEDLSPLKN
jgi:hypothetical protein